VGGGSLAMSKAQALDELIELSMLAFFSKTKLKCSVVSGL
jgi:hypothetical protein